MAWSVGCHGWTAWGCVSLENFVSWLCTVDNGLMWSRQPRVQQCQLNPAQSLKDITFLVSRRQCEMYVGHACLCVCLSIPHCISTLLHGPGCSLANGSGCPVVVHDWADLQSVHGFRCYDSIARTWNVCECLYSLYAWLVMCSWLGHVF